MKFKHPVAAKRQDYRVTLWKDGHPKDYLVSRLVASAWLGVPSEKMTVNHIDGDWRNNNASNLEWVTIADNIRHGFKNGMYDSVFHPISLIDEDGTVFDFESNAAADRFLQRSHSYLNGVFRRNGDIALSSDGKKYTIIRGGEI